MPKRKPDQVIAVRLEMNEKERDLLGNMIGARLAGDALQGAGNALGGIGRGLGVLLAAWITKEGIEAFTGWLKNDREQWEQENLTPEAYQAYIQIRTDQWIAEACKQGRYAPAIGDQDRYTCWHALDPSAGVVWQPLTFEEWEQDKPPPLLYEQWADAKREAATRDRERTLGYGYVKDWLDLKLKMAGWKD